MGNNEILIGELKGIVQSLDENIKGLREDIKALNCRIGKVENFNWRMILLIIGASFIGGGLGDNVIQTILSKI